MATLLLENGPDRGKGLDLKPGETYTLGRDPTCQLVVHGELVSRQHCRVKEFKGAYWVKDLDSLNGMFLNDQRVQQAELKPGDKLQLGDVVLTFLDETLAKSKEERILGGYRLLERVGRGGMGTVYRAIQISLDREVAFKVLSPDLVKDKAFVEQFFREARAAGQLNHPHIVSVYDVGQIGDTYYYSMEFVRGGSLEDRLREEGKLPVPEVLRIALEAAMALEYAESRHIVHRDIKPDNLMLAEDGRVRVADLGLALSLKSSADHKGQPILGTPHFLSPEQALRRDVDIRSDLYSLGATMYRMLAGQTVFTGASAEEIIKKAVREEPRPLRELNPEVPEKVAALVHQLLEKEPADRLASAKELREQLQHLTRHPGRTKALIAASCIAVIAIGVAIAFALKKPQTTIQVVESGDVLAERRNAYNAKSEADKRKIELDAVRGYLSVFETPRERGELRASLETWLKANDYLDLAEEERARGHVREIDAAIAREDAARRAAEQARQAALIAARESVQQPLGRGEAVAAFLAAAAIAPERETDDVTRAALELEKEKLLGEARAKVDAQRAEREQAIEAATAAGNLAEALSLSSEAERTWTPPEGAAEAVRAELVAVRDAFAKRRGELETTASESARATASADAKCLADALAQPTRRAILELDLAGAAVRVDAALAAIKTPELRAELEPVASSLRRGEALLSLALAQLESGAMAAEPPLRLAGDDKARELAGFDRDKRLVKFTIKERRGDKSQTVPLADLANANALRQLLFGRMQLTPEQCIDLAELLTLVEVTRWAEGLAPLADRLAQYDAKSGWTDEQRQGLALAAAGALADEVQLVLKDLPGSQVDAAARVRTRAIGEERCQEELAAALEPFLKRDASIGWAASCEALRKLLIDRRETLLLRFVRPWITGT